MLSKLPGLETEDRVFTTHDTLYMGMYSHSVDASNMKKFEYELKDASKNKLKSSFSRNPDGSFSASVDLSTLPSSLTTWAWKGKLEDQSQNKYEASAAITVNP